MAPDVPVDDLPVVAAHDAEVRRFPIDHAIRRSSGPTNTETDISRIANCRLLSLTSFDDYNPQGCLTIEAMSLNLQTHGHKMTDHN